METIPKPRIEFRRRRYGNRTTFTWVSFVTPDGEWIRTGDPFQSVVVSKKDINRLIELYWNPLFQ